MKIAHLISKILIIKIIVIAKEKQTNYNLYI